jgi:hypothetical protein
LKQRRKITAGFANGIFADTATELADFQALPEAALSVGRKPTQALTQAMGIWL